MRSRLKEGGRERRKGWRGVVPTANKRSRDLKDEEEEEEDRSHGGRGG